MVETESSARSRGAPVYAEVAGYGSSCDAYHRVQLDQTGIEPARAMSMSIEDAGIRPEDVDYVNLHGTSTVLNDPIETRAPEDVFGPPCFPDTDERDKVHDRSPTRSERGGRNQRGVVGHARGNHSADAEPGRPGRGM